MKNIRFFNYRFLFLFSLLFFVFILEIAAQWTEATLAKRRSDIFPLAVGNKVYFFGGDPTGNVLDIYDNATNKWKVIYLTFNTRGFLSKPGIVVKKSIFIIPNSEEHSDEVYMLDTDSDVITPLKLSEPRSAIGIGYIGDFVVFAGGFGSTGPSKVIDMYNRVQKTWTKRYLSEGRAFVSIGSIGYEIFFAGGVYGNSPSDIVDIYNTQTQTWRTAKLSIPRGMMDPVKIGNKLIFTGGGVPDFVPFNAVDIYDGDTDQWLQAELKQYVFSNILQSAVIGNKVFFAGGTGVSSNKRIIDIFDVQTNSWDTIHSPNAHQLFSMVVLNNRVILAGGIHTPNVDIFDVNSNSWVDGGQLSEHRYRIAGATSGNKAIFAGGDLVSGDVTNKVDIYTDETTNISETGTFQPFIVYPNPFQYGINLKISPNEPFEILNVSIYDISGNEVFKFNEVYIDKINSNIQYWNGNFLNQPSFQNGIYFIVCGTTTGTYYQKIVKI